MANPTDQLLKVKEAVIKCRKCSLYKTRHLPVIGQGSHNARVMFIGEAPGASEDQTGVPFCGNAGRILDLLLGEIKISRQDVYICNILKDRPPNNRNPKPDEINACTPYLDRQIAIINPKILCTLGNYATTFILNKFGLNSQTKGISQIHGKIFTAQNKKILPLYHPAVAVYNQNMIGVLKKDMAILTNL